MLTYRAFDLRDDEDPLLARVYFDMPIGYSEPAEVRGEDDVVPEAAGRELGARIKDRRLIQLEGHVRGIGADTAARTADWRASTDLLTAAIQQDGLPGDLVVGGGYLGITGTASLSARVIRVIPGPITNRMSFQTWGIQLECVDSPPEWVAGSS